MYKNILQFSYYNNGRNVNIKQFEIIKIKYKTYTTYKKIYSICKVRSLFRIVKHVRLYIYIPYKKQYFKFIYFVLKTMLQIIVECGEILGQMYTNYIIFEDAFLG